MEGCRKGDRRAQEKLYRQLYGFAMSIALRYATDNQDAASILSNAFVKMFRSIDRFDTVKGTLHAWLKKIIINEALDSIRQRSRFSTEELPEAAEPDIPNAAIQRLDAAAVLELIRRLPPATHAVFVLYAIEGYTHKETAQALGISEGTSKWHLSEARKILQQQLTRGTT